MSFCYFRSGRPRVTTRREDRHIVRAHLRNRYLPAAETSRDMRISAKTVRRRLKAANLHARRPYRGIFLTRMRRARRLAWAQANQYRCGRYWRRVLFSDERRFSLVNADGDQESVLLHSALLKCARAEVDP